MSQASIRQVAPDGRNVTASGEGPTGVAIRSDGTEAIVWNDFSRTLRSIDLTWVPDTGQIGAGSHAWAVDPIRPLQDTYIGRKLFHTAGAGLSADTSVACAVCHPEGRTDRTVWAVPNDLRNPPSLAGRLEGTSPYNWRGDRFSLADKVL